MRLNEIGATSFCPTLNWNKAYLNLTSVYTKIDGHNILHFTDSIHDFYLIASNSGKLLAYIAVKNEGSEYLSLERIENISKNPRIYGLSTMIIIALVAKGMKFVIKDTESLTYSGISWLCKTLSINSELKITDQNDQVPTIKELQNEWETSKEAKGMPSGPTSIYIEDGGINISRINENNDKWNEAKLLKPLYHYFGDKRIL